MKIVRLSAKNVKRLRAVEIAPDGNVVVVGGKNGQGKTSVLDSIAYALGGKDQICREPVRRGAKRAEIVCDLGELIVRRTFSEDGGGQLVLEGKDGARFPSPQGRIDDLIGRLSLDPLAFSRMEPAKQAETLRNVLGLDFAELDAERAEAYAKRTDVNRDGKQLRARYDALPERHEGVPAAEESLIAIVDELNRAQAHNASNAEMRSLAADAEKALMAKESLLAELLENVKNLQADVDLRKKRVAEMKSQLANLTDVDAEPIRTRLAAVDTVNRKVRQNAENAQLAKELSDLREMSIAYSEAIERIDETKQSMIAKAQLPVPGLGFSAEGHVTLDGLPFEQASAAEQLRASVAIGLALNPKLRVLLIRDGSLLDEDSLKLIAELAAAQDAQLWIERVEEDGGATVVIEDGSVVGAPAPEVAAS